MSGFELTREDGEGAVTLRLEGHFDRSAAEVLQRMVGDVEPDAALVVDFSRVREFPDLAVGLVSAALGGRPVQLRGLGTHHERMFGYFGLGVRRDERAYYTPEERVA